MVTNIVLRLFPIKGLQGFLPNCVVGWKLTLQMFFGAVEIELKASSLCGPWVVNNGLEGKYKQFRPHTINHAQVINRLPLLAEKGMFLVFFLKNTRFKLWNLIVYRIRKISYEYYEKVIMFEGRLEKLLSYYVEHKVVIYNWGSTPLSFCQFGLANQWNFRVKKNVSVEMWVLFGLINFGRWTKLLNEYG